jgi:excinuclease ABC subunit A
MKDAIILRNVQTHNLKGINVEIAHGSLTVVTGVSGSGKSSLAFDTLYAEGRRRYVESMSTYARQFLERIEKPDVETVTGILPAIAIEAKNAISNARSTVGTQTEINDYLRLFFARVGVTFCDTCGDRVQSDTPEHIESFLEKKLAHKEVFIAFPVSFGSKSKKYAGEVVDEFRKQGFTQFVVHGAEIEIDQIGKHIQKGLAEMLVVLDHLEVDAAERMRLVDSLESALRSGTGRVVILTKKGKTFTEHRFSTRFHCARCDKDYREPTPNAFSFNSPLGACSECQGFGRIITIDWNLVIPNPKLSLAEGAIEPWTKPSCSWERRELKKFCTRKNISMTTPFQELSQTQKDWILNGMEGDSFFSVQDFFDYLEKKTYKMHVRIFLSKYRGFVLCRTCQGTRLKKEALTVRVGDRNISELCQMTLGALKHFFDTLLLTPHEAKIAEPLLIEIKNRILFLVEVGLEYLTLDRLSRTLSGGESQRIRLAASLGSQLVDTLYVLDEPSVGLHERDHALVIGILRKLKDLGNTVVVVEHDRTMIEASDQVIDMGPLGGERGGEIIFAGRFKDLKNVKNSHTARYFRNELRIERANETRNGFKKSILVQGASEHNLKNISLKIPLSGFTAITGVSGSGKSTLMYDVLYANYKRWKGRAVQGVGRVKKITGWEHVEDLYLIDQSPIGKTPRSNPVTYMKAFDGIRNAFSKTREARARKLTAGHFSFNGAGGRCPQCQGAGMQKIEMHFLADVFVTCETCEGTRYQPRILEISYHGKNIHEALSLTIDQALQFFEDEGRVAASLAILTQVGLGHLRLGQSATTLSGGEAQRLKLASELVRGKMSVSGKPLLYLFDEPTTGLHYYDIQALVKSFETLLSRGHAICVIEHNMEMIKCADYVIDLGPEGGSGGGALLYEGALSGLLTVSESHTGRLLARYLKEPCSHASA